MLDTSCHRPAAHGACLQQSGTLAPGGTKIEKYVEEMMDSLTEEEFDAFFSTEEALRTLPIGPRINGFRCSVGRHVCGSSNPVAEVRGTSCGAEMEVSGS